MNLNHRIKGPNTWLRLITILLGSVTFLAITQITNAQTTLSDISHWNYENIGGPGFGNAFYASPVTGLFENTANGITIKTSSSRGAGAITTKDLFSLAGTTLDYVWSGSGGSSFSQPVLATLTTQWNTDPGAVENNFVNVSYGNSYNGSWVAAPGRVYETQVNISSGNYTSVTTDLATGTLVANQSGNFNFSTPLHIEFRQGDTFDNQNSYLALKSLNIASSIPVPTNTPLVSALPAPSIHAVSDFVFNVIPQHASEFDSTTFANLTTNANSTAPLIANNHLKNVFLQNESAALGQVSLAMSGLSSALSPGSAALNATEFVSTTVLQDVITNSVPASGQSLLDTAFNAFGLFKTVTAASNPVSLALSIDSFLLGTVLKGAVDYFATDPADPNFLTVYLPNIPQLPLSSTGNPTLDAALQKQTLDVTNTIAYLVAVNASFDKYSGAIQAGDSIHAVMQMAALLNYLKLYNQAAQNAAADIVATQALMTSLGMGTTTVDKQQLIALQTQISSSGLSSDIINLFNQLGLTSAQMDDAKNALLALDPNAYTATLDDANNLASNTLLAGTAVVPEPSAAVLLGLAACVFTLRRRSPRRVGT